MNIQVLSNHNRLVIGTHEGEFSNDDIVACAIVSLLHDGFNIQILRSNDMYYLLSTPCDIVIGIGEGPFDSSGKPNTTNSELVWKEFGEALITKIYWENYHNNSISKPFLEKCFNTFNYMVIKNVDTVFDFSTAFCSYKDYNESFKEALSVTCKILEMKILQVISSD